MKNIINRIFLHFHECIFVSAKLQRQVDPIFDLGGYVAVSKSLAAQGVDGVLVSASPKPAPPPKIELLGPPPTVGVALGNALDERLAEASRLAWVNKNKAGNEPEKEKEEEYIFAVQRRGRRLVAASAAASANSADNDLRGMPEAPTRYTHTPKNGFPQPPV